jgi:nickel/cobalt exporter
VRRLALVLSLALAASAGFSQEVPNPFTAKGAHPREGIVHSLTSNFSALVSNAMAPVQKTLNESLAALTRSLKGSRSLGGLLFVALISLVYGVFHAAGPGHGKTIVSSFFLANNAKLRHSVTIGYLIAGVHSLAALAVVLVLYYLVRGLFSASIEQANHWIQLGSFAVLAVLGAFMLVGRVRGGGHHHHVHAGAPEPARGVSFRSLVGIAIPAGVIPCPGAVAVILFAISLNLIGVSILSVVAISAGMGLTISVTGALVILAKRGVLSAFSRRTAEHESTLRRVVEIGGAGVLFLFGLLFFLAQL